MDTRRLQRVLLAQSLLLLWGTAALALASCRSAGSWEARSLDGRTRVRVAGRNRGPCVRVGQRLDGCFDGVALGTVVVSPRGDHVAYGALVGNRWTVVHDGVVTGRWDGVGSPMLSPDGARVAYAAEAGGAWRVVVDGEPGAAFDRVLAGSLRFGPGGGRVAYAATRHERTHVVVDRQVSRAWERVAQLSFDPSGEHVGYVALDAVGARVVIDDWTGPVHPAVGALVLGGSRAATPDWSAPVRSAYVATTDDGRARVVVDGAAGPVFDGVRALTLPEPLGAAYVAIRGNREGLARDGRVSAWHERVVSIACAADGRCGYAADDGDGSSIVVAGRTVARAPWASDVALGAAGRWAGVIGERDGAVVVDESGRYAFDLVLAGTLQYVGDGSRWACLAGHRKRRELFLVVDGTVLDRLDWATITRETGRGGDPQVVREWVSARAASALTPGPRSR